jgi:hypothetical protein
LENASVGCPVTGQDARRRIAKVSPRPVKRARYVRNFIRRFVMRVLHAVLAGAVLLSIVSAATETLLESGFHAMVSELTSRRYEIAVYVVLVFSP